MKRVKNALLVLGTLAMVAAGAVMPRVAGVVQDSYGANTQESRSFDAFRLTLRQDSETAKLLRRLGGGNYWIEEAVGGEQAVHTPRQAGEAAREVLERMVKCGVMDADILERLELPKANACALRRDSDLSVEAEGKAGNQAALGLEPDTESELLALAWDCWWPDMEERQSPMVRIDDAAEKVLMAMIPTPCKGGVLNLDAQVDGWQTFLEEHYGFEVMSIEEKHYPSGDAQYIFDLDPEDGEGVLRIRLEINAFDGADCLSFLWPASIYDF